MDIIDAPIAGRDLEALAIETHRAVGTTLLSLHLDAERRAQFIAPGALAPDVGPGEVALQGPLPQFTVLGAMVFLSDPGLGGEVQLLERETDSRRLPSAAKTVPCHRD